MSDAVTMRVGDSATTRYAILPAYDDGWHYRAWCPTCGEWLLHRKQSWARSGGFAATGTRSAVLPDASDPDLDTPNKITAAIETTAGPLVRGEIAPSIAVALNALYGSALRAYDSALGRRLSELEAWPLAREARRRPAGVAMRRSVRDRIENLDTRAPGKPRNHGRIRAVAP